VELCSQGKAKFDATTGIRADEAMSMLDEALGLYPDSAEIKAVSQPFVLQGSRALGGALGGALGTD
jgi:hypothetical protein